MRARNQSDLPTPTPDDTAEYMCDMLVALHKISDQDHHKVLSIFLQLATAEACRIRDHNRAAARKPPSVVGAPG